jgi:hypothetical protein
MSYKAVKHAVLNRGVPPDRFLDELIAWGKTAPDDIFAQNPGKNRYRTRWPYCDFAIGEEINKNKQPVAKTGSSPAARNAGP